MEACNKDFIIGIINIIIIITYPTTISSISPILLFIASLRGLTASLVTISRMQQCFNGITDIYKNISLLYFNENKIDYYYKH